MDGQEQKIEKLEGECLTLKDSLKKKDSLIADLRFEIKVLEEKFKRKLYEKFARSAELYKALTPLFDEAEQEALKTEENASSTDNSRIKNGKNSRKSKGKIEIPENFPREIFEHGLSEEKKICSKDANKLHKIGEEVTEQIEIIPPQIKVIQHIVIKYGCRECEEEIKTGSKSKSPIPGSVAGPGLLAYLATQKYMYALPLYRQEQMFAQIGVNISRASLANWMIRISELLSPIVDKLREKLISESQLINMDETRIQVLKEKGRKATSQSQMWVMARGDPGDQIILFNYDKSRGQEVPQKLLGDYRGYLQVDGYDGYSAVCATGRVKRVGCFAHVRRKFFDIVKTMKNPKGSIADEGMAWVQKLYEVDKSHRSLSIEERNTARNKEMSPLFKEFEKWVETNRNEILPKSSTAKALNYAYNEWPYLKVISENGLLTMDNNRAERAIRPFTIGRKNWLFADTPKGAEASATLYSLIETAKANILDPFNYLKSVLERLPNLKTNEKIEDLLPLSTFKT